MTEPKLALIPSAYKAGTLYSPLPANGDGDFTFTRNSVATRLDKDGLIEEVAINTPRLDYSDGSCPSLLLEPSRTNIVTYSEDFSNSSWIKTNCTINSNNAISPDGTQNADKLDFTTSNGEILNVPTFVSGQEYTMSFYAKTESGTLDFTYGNMGYTSVSGTATTEWQRFELTQTLPTTVRYPKIQTTEIGSLLLWGFQIEQGSHATSYIPTNGSIATRVADLCAGSGDADVFNDDEGVLYVETGVRVDNGFISLNNGGTSNRVSIYFNETNKTIRPIISKNSASQMDTTYTSPTSISDNVKVAMKYKENDFALWVNGVEVLTDSSGLTPIGLDRFDFSVNGILPFYGKCKEVKYYDKALTDAELTELTTL